MATLIIYNGTPILLLASLTNSHKRMNLPTPRVRGGRGAGYFLYES